VHIVLWYKAIIIAFHSSLRLPLILYYIILYYIILYYYYYYYYVKVMFAHSYSENSHERANKNNML